MKHIIEQVWDTLPRGLSFIRPLAFCGKIEPAHPMGLPCFSDSKSRTAHTQENAIQGISRKETTQVVSAATYATGNMGSPVSAAQTANTLNAHISIVRGALLFSSWVHIRGGCTSDQLPSSNISHQAQAVPQEVQEPQISKPFPAKGSGDPPSPREWKRQ